MKIGICPGSFDPITRGHLDIIKRASSLFDKVIVLVVHNPAKHPSFTPEERVELIRRSIGDFTNVEVDVYGGLLADYCRAKGADAIIKGLRAVSDFEYEFQISRLRDGVFDDQRGKHVFKFQHCQAGSAVWRGYQRFRSCSGAL